MLVANSFDLWQKDAFFSAAEEVQESADIMESAYRKWVRERKERLSPENMDEFCRELQTTLGTAKWQLEEFERAVRVSYGHRGDDSSTARHSQFISAIGSQISHVELALREYFLEEGKKPLRWVNLNEEECDDLAAFLAGTSQITNNAKDETNGIRTPVKRTHPLEENQIKGKVATSLQSSASSKRGVYDEILSIKEEFTVNQENNAMEPGQQEVYSVLDNKTANARRTWSTPNFGDLKIVIADGDKQRNQQISNFETSPKEKGSKLIFWRKRCGELSRGNGPVQLFNQLCSRASGSHSQRQFHNPPRMQYGCSVQFHFYFPQIEIKFYMILFSTCSREARNGQKDSQRH